MSCCPYARAVAAVAFRDELAAIVTSRGASLRLGFKGRFAYLQAQWPGAEEALSLLRAENFEVVRYLTEAEEAQHPEEPSTERGRRLSAERAELAFMAVEMRGEIDALVQRTLCRPRLANDGKRAWLCVQALGDWIPVLRCRKGAVPERFDLQAALTAARPDTKAIRRGQRRTTPAAPTTEQAA
jgi:hypothetical protein